MDYLNPIEYNWERADDGFLTPDLTDLPPAASVIVEMSLCHCKAPCNINICVCKKVESKCTEMCFCQNRENCDSEDYSGNDVEDEISDEENL